MAARKENAKNKSWSRALVDWRFWDDKEALFDRVSKALKKGADLDSIDTAKWTALHFSCFKPNKQTAKVVELLLEKGVALHAVNRDKQTALHLAIASKASLEVVKVLLEKGARVGAADKQNRWTVLHYATVYGANIKVVEILLENDEPLAESGGALYARAVEDKTVLHLACIHKASAAVVQLLLERSRPPALAPEGSFDSLAQSPKQSVDQLEELEAKEGSDAQAHDLVHAVSETKVAIHYAAKHKASKDVMALLLEHGADVHAVGDHPSAKTVLHFAAEHQAKPEIIELLLEHGADAHALTEYKKTALHFAAEYQADPEVVALLLGEAADVNAVDGWDKRTPLELAARYDAGPVVMGLLISAGALNRNIYGGTILTPGQESRAEAAVRNYMQIDEDFIKRISPPNAKRIGVYIDALTKAPGEEDDTPRAAAAAKEQCPNKWTRLAEARALQAVAAAVDARDQPELQKTVATAMELMASPEGAGENLKSFQNWFEYTAIPLLDLLTLEKEKKDAPNVLRFYFVHRDVIIEMHRSGVGVQVFQDLRKRKQLKQMSVDTSDILQGALRAEGSSVLAISYPWQGFGDPDSTGERLEAVATHLEENKTIDYVWWDFMCVPQNTNIPDWHGDVEHPYATTYSKNPFEKLYFQSMINEGGVNLIYLGAFVLSVVNGLYIQRFWTQFEFFLGTRSVNEKEFSTGLGRISVKCIQSLQDSNTEQTAALEAKWANVSTDQAVLILKQWDVTVTNKSDKRNLLRKLPKLEAAYTKLVRGMTGEQRKAMYAGQKAENKQALLRMTSFRPDADALSQLKELKLSHRQQLEELKEKHHKELEKLEAEKQALEEQLSKHDSHSQAHHHQHHQHHRHHQQEHQANQPAMAGPRVSAKIHAA